jgi:hypothetical protein
MRSLIKVGALTLTALVASAAFVGCSSENSKKQGTGSIGGNKNAGTQGGIGLELQPVPGLTINSVHYAITGGTGAGGSAIPTIEGDLPTPGTASNFSFGVPLPVATGYQLSLTAESAETGDSITCTGGFGPFNVTPNNITNLTLTLTCVDTTNGQIVGRVDVVTDACPTLKVNYAVATPYAANVGSSLEVLSNATDTNAALPITYQWSVASPIGNFATANAANSTFNCTAGGNDVLVTVTASNGSCDKSLSTVVSCLNVLCGNGAVDPSEACDNSGPDGTDNPLCLPNCTLAVCGNGTLEAPVEACEPPNSATCNATCQIRTPSCGDTFVTPPETCEPPNTATCSATCTSLAAAVCGDGTVGAGETCDNPGGNNYAIENCGDVWGQFQTPATTGGDTSDCQVITPAACQTCEAGSASCAEFIDVGGCAFVTGNADTGSPAAGTPRADLCREVLDCVRDTDCAQVFAEDCYCGTASPSQCAAGNGNGACRRALERGLETTVPDTINARFTAAAFGGGFAMARVQCDKAECTAACGF